MAERKVYTPPAAPAPDDRTPEEIAAASRPAAMTLDKRGGAPQFTNIPPPAQKGFQADVRRLDPVEPGAGTPPAASPNAIGPVVPGLPAGSAPADSPFSAYESTNPMSKYDKDIEFTHTLSRMLGMAGLGEKAAGMRDLNMKLQHARMDDIGADAQRAFLAGDVTKGIDMFNHAVPNGQKITGYRKNTDGTLSFQMADGKTETKSPRELAETLTAFRDPNIMSGMMKDRAKTLAETQQQMALAGYKGSIDIQKAIVMGKINHENAMSLETLKAQLGADRITIAMDGTPWVAQRGGGVMSLKMGKNPLTGKPEWQQDQIIAPQGLGTPGATGAPGAAAPTGTKVDARALATQLGLVAPQ